MPKLYLANTTKQHREFQYRIPGQQQLFRVSIPAGSQTTLPHQNLTEYELRAIIDSQARYGLIDQKNIPNMRAYTGLCYSIEKEIDMRRVVAAIEKNDEFLRQTVEASHADNLAAADHVLKSQTGGHGSMATLEFEEKAPEGSQKKTYGKRMKIAGAQGG